MNPSAPVPVAPALAWCLHLLVVGLLALAAGRAVLTGQPNAALVGALCAAVGVAYAVGPLTPSVGVVPRATAAWLTSVSVLWLALLAASADGIWIAFPLFFLYLHLLPRRAGLAAVILATAAAITGFAVHQGALAVGTVIGPALGAAVAVAVVWGYQALHHQSDERRRLIDQLTDARADLAAAQHAAGVLAERERLGREIHDTLAQGLASIQLLLRAAGRALPTDADKAGGYVEQARATAADNLAEARRFVAALSPPALDGSTLADALDRLCATVAVPAMFRQAGHPFPLPTDHEVALLRIAQSALTNTVQHADAGSARLDLTYLDDAVTLTVTDDGTGFNPAGAEIGGYGLAAMRARAVAVGGAFTVDSAVGAGATVAVRLPRVGLS